MTNGDVLSSMPVGIVTTNAALLKALKVGWPRRGGRDTNYPDTSPTRKRGRCGRAVNQRLPRLRVGLVVCHVLIFGLFVLVLVVVVVLECSGLASSTTTRTRTRKQAELQRVTWH